MNKNMKKITAIVAAEEFDKLTDKDIRAYIEYSMTTRHTGKMAGLTSISTSCKDNTICQERAKNKDSICAHCFSQSQLSYQKDTRNKMHLNYLFYTNVKIKPEQVPFINVAFLRLEAFGDLQNETQFNNYVTILKANKHIRQATLWTKNPHIIRQALDHGTKKPRNMRIILSSPMMNDRLTSRTLELAGCADLTDAVFTVYDKSFAKVNNIDINCGGRKCAECQKCYTLSGNKITYIQELLK